MSEKLATLEDFERLKKIKTRYKRVFGENSLERCIEFMFDPWYPEQSKVREAADELQQAIDTGQPLDQSPEELFNQIVF